MCIKYMNTYILTFCLILIILIIINHSFKESFLDYIDNIDYNDKEVKTFCTELYKLNKLDNNTLLLKKYNKRLKEKKGEEIGYLKTEIDKLYLNRLNKEIDNNNNYRLSSNSKIDKQLKIIDLTIDVRFPSYVFTDVISLSFV